jgi:F-type H+-transporting ATPase subunit b
MGLFKELFKLLIFNEIVAQSICFLVLVGILRIFLWKKFLKILDDRRQTIARELNGIEEAKRDVAAMRTDYESRLSKINEEAREKLEQAQEEGRAAAEAVKKNAEEESRRFFDKAKNSISVEIANAREELKDQIVAISVEVAEKVIEERLTEDTDRKLAQKFLREIGSGK